jgi:hypothetical protein
LPRMARRPLPRLSRPVNPPLGPRFLLPHLLYKSPKPNLGTPFCSTARPLSRSHTVIRRKSLSPSPRDPRRPPGARDRRPNALIRECPCPPSAFGRCKTTPSPYRCQRLLDEHHADLLSLQSKQHHKRRSVVRARSFFGDAPPRLSGGAAALSAPVTKLHRPLSAIGSSTNGVDQNPRTPSAPVHHGPMNQPREHRSTSPRPRHGHVICSS